MTSEKPRIESLPLSIGQKELDEITVAASTMVQAVRQHMFAPEQRKQPPTFSATDICNTNKLNRAKFHYFAKKNPELPKGIIKGNRLEFSLKETVEWNRFLSPEKMRNSAINCAVTIAIANFKGGVTKTTTVVTLAQGLALRGYKVLVVDLDPQGSATSLFGVLPDIDVEDNTTALLLYTGEEPSLEYAIRPTYWTGIDLVPGSVELHNVEFIVPTRQLKNPSFDFWTILDKGLDSVRDNYDIILIDSPPALSYTTVNAIMASDGLIMPIPPSPLDFASSAQFWGLINDMIQHFNERTGTEKKFNFIDVVLSRVDNRIGVSATVRDWMIRTYGSKVLPVEIPRTSIADTSSAAFGTVYNMQQTESIAKTLKRAREAYELLVEYVENQVQGIWAGVAEKYEGEDK